MGRRKRKEQERGKFNKAARRRGDPLFGERLNYEPIEKVNESYELYYKGQDLIPPENWEDFITSLRAPLPATFRITGCRSQAQELLRVVKGDFMSKLVDVEIDGKRLEAPKCLSWFPDGLAWQLDLSRSTIRHSAALEKLHKFLVSETESGNISRQEAVSMIPPLVLDVKPQHKVLDMCAAPGSKTAQIIEMLHADESVPVPEGFVIANDADNKRCYLMTHQVKRLASPNFIVMNHDAAILPNLRMNKEEDGPGDWVQFDRILADVPCTGDGTLRKNADIWSKWTPAAAHSLHGIQARILRRGCEMLVDGGRIVYSTCSLNPIEDEAVVAGLLRAADGSMELMEVAEEVPGLNFCRGVNRWKVMDKSNTWYTTYDDVPEKLHCQIRPHMFPPSPAEAEKFHLERCMRILPHQQDSGGFFVAVFRKLSQVPWMKKESNEDVLTSEPDADTTDATNAGDEKTKEEILLARKRRIELIEGPGGVPQPKKKKLRGYKEDPFVFFEANEDIWPGIKKFYSISDDFPVEQLLVRTKEGRKRGVYFASKQVRDIVVCNEGRIKFINLGLKVLNRSDSKNSQAEFRLVQDGAKVLFPHIAARKVPITCADVITLLSTENPFMSRMSKSAHAALEDVSKNEGGPGGMVFQYLPEADEPGPRCPLILCGWLGTTSCRSFMPKNERAHYLRICGAEAVEKMKTDTRDVENDDESKHSAKVGPSSDDEDCVEEESPNNRTEQAAESVERDQAAE